MRFIFSGIGDRAWVAGFYVELHRKRLRHDRAVLSESTGGVAIDKGQWFDQELVGNRIAPEPEHAGFGACSPGGDVAENHRGLGLHGVVELVGVKGREFFRVFDAQIQLPDIVRAISREPFKVGHLQEDGHWHEWISGFEYGHDV